MANISSGLTFCHARITEERSKGVEGLYNGETKWWNIEPKMLNSKWGLKKMTDSKNVIRTIN
jgi:hypothetical protein